MMAQVAAVQGSLKLLFSGEAPAASAAASLGPEPRDPRRCSSELRSKWHLQKLKLGLSSASSAAASSSSSARSELLARLYTRYSASTERLLDEYDYDSEAEEDELACFRGLVLDISDRPVDVVCWRRAICLELMEKVDVLEYYDQTVSFPSGSFHIPAVLRVPHLLQVVKRRRIMCSLTKKNILHRDKYACQYCLSEEDLTIDHVLPVAQGGKWEWGNLVTACSKCNSRKGSKTLEEADMKLIKVPKAPKDYDILAVPLTSAAIKMLRMSKGTPEEWRRYLSRPSPES